MEATGDEAKEMLRERAGDGARDGARDVAREGTRDPCGDTLRDSPGVSISTSRASSSHSVKSCAISAEPSLSNGMSIT